MQKTFIFLCSQGSQRIAFSALSSNYPEEYNLTFVDSDNAEQILADNISDLSNVVIAVCLGGRSGGKKAIQLAELLKANNVKASLVASLPFKNEGIERNRRAMIDFLRLISYSHVQTIIKNDCVNDNNTQSSLASQFEQLNQIFITAIVSTTILADEIPQPPNHNIPRGILKPGC